MPAHTPPAAVRAGDVSSAMIRSTPGAMPSVRRPRTVALNGSAVVPESTVQPVALRPFTAWSVGSSFGQSTGRGSGSAPEARSAGDAGETVRTAHRTAPTVTGTRAAGRFMAVPPRTSAALAGVLTIEPGRRARK